MVLTDESIGVSQLILGARAQALPKSTPMALSLAVDSQPVTQAIDVRERTIEG